MCAQMLKRTRNNYLNLKYQFEKIAHKIKVKNLKSVNVPQCDWGLD